MLHLLLGLGLYLNPHARPDSTATQFTAVLQPDAAISAARGSGAVDLTVGPDGLHYDLAIAGLNHVTNVVVLDGEHTVGLYNGPASGRDVLKASGNVPGREVVGESLRQLLQDLRAGKVQVAAFTTEEPGGVLQGVAQPEARG